MSAIREDDTIWAFGELHTAVGICRCGAPRMETEIDLCGKPYVNTATFDIDSAAAREALNQSVTDYLLRIEGARNAMKPFLASDPMSDAVTDATAKLKESIAAYEAARDRLGVLNEYAAWREKQVKQ